MTPEEEIFAHALPLTGEARRAYLDRACGADHILRENIEALLAAHASAGDFLAGSPAGEVLAGVEPQPGDRIGPYVVERKIGEGGCGLVFLAEQEAPLRRRVALKVIKPGMDSRQVILRFEAERQALARMEHPDIARVYEAGATPAGRPYFAMEYVEGVPITRFCDTRALPLAARLALFERVCLALQHAHQKGIVHRDIKPSNILVALHDGQPQPKVIDFGIAKATQARLTDATLLTGFEQFLGTPAYMSPEQAERRDLDIDTRSDIYSLGVLLYELLAGQPPFDPKSLVKAGLDEIRRIIREVEPPRPSTVLSTLGGADRATVARQRAVMPDRLTSVLRGDLDWIVMRCMEKDRARRYGTASELAADIRRHLRLEPVTARPPSVAYRARKFVRRHRVACTAGAAVALSLVASTVFSTAQAIRAHRAEQEARRQREQAESLLTFMLGDFRTELKKIGQLKLLDAVGAQALAYFAALDPHGLSDVALARQAKALTQLGEVRLDEARYDDASKAFATAYDRAAALAARRPQEADVLFERGQAEYWLGNVARRRGDFPTARAWLARYRDTTLALTRLEGRTPRALSELAYGHRNVAVSHFDQGDLAAALGEFQAERTILAELAGAQPASAQLRGRIVLAASWLGNIAERTGDYAAAREWIAETAARLEELAREESTVAFWRERLIEALALLGDNRARAGETAEAAALYARGLALAEELASFDEKNRQWQHSRAKLRLRQAELEVAQGATPATAQALEAVRSELAALAQAEPAATAYAATLAKAWRIEAQLRLATRATDAAAPAARAIEVGAPLVRQQRADHHALGEYARACVLAGRIDLAEARPERARPHFERALATLAPALPASRDWQVLDPAMQALVLLGRPAEARPLAERLRAFGYRPRDPFAASALEAALQSSTSRQP